MKVFGRARVAARGSSLDTFATVCAVLMRFMRAEVFAVYFAMAVDAKSCSVSNHKTEGYELGKRFNVMCLNIALGSAGCTRPIIASVDFLTPHFQSVCILRPCAYGVSAFEVRGVCADHESVSTGAGAKTPSGLVGVVFIAAVLAYFNRTILPALFVTEKPLVLVKFIRPLERGFPAGEAFHSYFFSHVLTATPDRGESTVFRHDPKYADAARKRWAEAVHGEGCKWTALTKPVSKR